MTSRCNERERGKGMVKETLQIFDLGDLKAVRFHCNHCSGEVVQSILAYKMLKRCPLCAVEWEEQRMPNEPMGANSLLARAIQDVLQMQGLPMTMRFEVDAASDES